MNAMFFYVMQFSCLLALGQPASPARGPDREAVVAALRHHEGLIRTLKVDYEFSMLPTPPEKATLIRRILGKDAEASIFTPEFAKHYAGTARFWRKGAKQRDEWSIIAPDESPRTRAFDGEILRTLRHRGPDDRPVAAIASVETGNWYQMPREDPMAFIYLYYEQPLSDVIASAPTFSSNVVQGSAERLYRISVDGLPGGHILEFLMDEHFLQRERLVKIRYNRKQRPTFNHKLGFSGYHSYDTPSGEKIWFPGVVSYTGYLGHYAPDGSPLEGLWKEFRFTKVEFNLEMPDSLFELEIPKDARINDMLTGAGWLPEGERPALLFPAEARARRLLVAAVVIAALIIVTTAVFYKRWRRRSAAGGGSPGGPGHAPVTRPSR